MKHIPLFLFLISFLYPFKNCISQSKSVDSLKQVIVSHKNDTNEVKALIKLGQDIGWQVGNLDTAFTLLNQAKALSEKLGYKKGSAQTYGSLGIAYYYQGNYTEALKNHSLSKKLYSEIGDEIGIARCCMNAGVVYMEQGNYAEALKNYSLTLKIGKETGNKQLILMAYVNSGLAYDSQNNYPLALSNFSLALNVRKESGDKAGLAIDYTNIGTIYYSQGNYPEALKYHILSLKIKEELGDKAGIGQCYNNIGIVYNEQGNRAEGLKNQFAALKIFKAIGDKESIAISYNNIGVNYGDQGNYDEALKNYFSALEIRKEINDKYGLASCYINIAAIYAQKNKFAESIQNSSIALRLFKEIGDKNGEASCYSNIGAVYLRTNKLKEAKQWIQKGLALSREIGSKSTIRASYQGLARTDSALGNYKEAYNHYKLFILYRDSLLNEENTKKTVQTQMQYEFDKKQTADSIRVVEEKKVINAKLEKEKTQKYALYGGILFVAMVAVFMFNRFRVTQKQKQIIELKERETNQQKHIIEEKHKEITDSINYAERIQRSFLATQKHLSDNLNDYTIMFRPKDVVSGDFYWSATLINGYFALVTADSTGHGVPGAIMSLLNITSLEKAVEHHVNPNEILNHTRSIIIDRLKKDGSAEGGKDGMDCTLCVYDFKSLKLYVAAANNPVWIFRNEKEVIEIKPDKMPVGKHDKQNISFTMHEFDLKKGDTVYTLTDGFPDQFGGEKGKKFMSKNLREFILSNIQLPMNEQKQMLEIAFKNWIGHLEQVDDVTIIGIKI